MRKYGKYFADVAHLLKIDLYRFFKLFPINDHALEHAIKKIALGGLRTGEKTQREDITEARDTLNRWLEMLDEDELAGHVNLVRTEADHGASSDPVAHEIDHAQHCEYTLEQAIGDSTLSDWAEWVAVDESGIVCEFDAEPVRENHNLEGIFASDGRLYNEINSVAPPKNWEICLFKVENANKTIQA